MERLCPRDGTLERGAATCAGCGLRLNERLKLADVNELQSFVDAALVQLSRARRRKRSSHLRSNARAVHF
jgi:hypothetical protein